MSNEKDEPEDREKREKDEQRKSLFKAALRPHVSFDERTTSERPPPSAAAPSSSQSTAAGAKRAVNRPPTLVKQDPNLLPKPAPKKLNPNTKGAMKHRSFDDGGPMMRGIIPLPAGSVGGQSSRLDAVSTSRREPSPPPAARQPRSGGSTDGSDGRKASSTRMSTRSWFPMLATRIE